MSKLSELKIRTPLYQSDTGEISYLDFVKALKKVGLASGDVIFVHSDIAPFGKLCTFDKTLLLKTLTEAIKESIGWTGTIIMPTFTYSFCKDEVFDPTYSKSTVGVLTEHFRSQPDVVRTNHPIFSVAIWGSQKEIFVDVGKDSFGKHSIFEKLHHQNAKIVFLGAPFQSCTFLHYVEQIHGIPYRFMKTFRGTVNFSGLQHESECTFFVRPLDNNVVFDTSKLERYLLDNNFLRQTNVGNGKVLMVEAKALFDKGIQLLDQDIYFFLTKEPT